METVDDVIIGAFENGQITKFGKLMGDYGGVGRKGLLDGKEVGFTILKVDGEWVVRGSGTGSPIGNGYLTPDQAGQIKNSFGIK